MSLERPPERQRERAAYSLDEFCEDHRISRSMIYKRWDVGIGPRRMNVGARVLISAEAAADWRREREAASQEDSDEAVGDANAGRK
jgi:hypothetical protein